MRPPLFGPTSIGSTRSTRPRNPMRSWCEFLLACPLALFLVCPPGITWAGGELHGFPLAPRAVLPASALISPASILPPSPSLRDTFEKVSPSSAELPASSADVILMAREAIPRPAPAPQPSTLTPPAISDDAAELPETALPDALSDEADTVLSAESEALLKKIRPETLEVIDLSGGDERAPIPVKLVEVAGAGPAPYGSLPSVGGVISTRPLVQEQAPLPTRATIVRVVDGDTYLLDDGHKVRLSGVNTPEKSERIGQLVKEAVKHLLTGKEVTLTYGPTSKDHYGRLIAEVWLDGKSVPEILLSNGWAHLFIIPPGRPERYDALVAAQREARRLNRGIWGEERYRGELHITSFHANARGDDSVRPDGEYVRIANTSGKDLNLEGYVVTNAKGRKLLLPAVVIPEGYTFQLVSGVGRNQGSLTESYKIYWNSNGPVWNNDADTVTLLDPQGQWIDEAVHAPKRTRAKIASH